MRFILGPLIFVNSHVGNTGDTLSEEVYEALRQLRPGEVPVSVQNTREDELAVFSASVDLLGGSMCSHPRP